jgi:hypothetical protein
MRNAADDRPRQIRPRAPDPGIIPGGIRDRALQAMGYPVPPWWYRKAEKAEPDEAAGRARSPGEAKSRRASDHTEPVISVHDSTGTPVSASDYKSFLAMLKGEHSAEPALPSEQKSSTLPSTSRNNTLEAADNSLALKLERVTEKALDKADDILSLPLPEPDDANFSAILRSQNAAANTILTTQVRVDENHLRKQQVDTLPQLIAEIAEYRKRQREMRGSDDEWLRDGELG